MDILPVIHPLYDVVYYADGGFTLAIISLVLTAVSAAYSVRQAQKQKDAAKKAREARKGFEVPIEGETGYLPKVYGRAKIGGYRVWHQTQGNFYYVATNGDKTFLTGYDPASAVDESLVVAYEATGPEKCGDDYTWNGIDMVCQLTVDHTNPKYETRLVRSFIKDKANSYIFFQQALCQAPIEGIYDVIVDDSRFLDDPTLGTDLYNPGQDDKSTIEAAFRADIHYDGSEYDSIIAKNFGERLTATFDDMTYANVIARLDRTNPQFHGVPQVQFVGEFTQVETVSGGVLSGTKGYSNNPAWVLLDYLMDPIGGKAVPVSKIDLDSFELAASVCAKTVQSNVSCSGKVWQSTDGVRNTLTRDLPLYECNVIIDPNKPIRDNIETILSTMGDARLVWSQGQYKLSVVYPANNTEIENLPTVGVGSCDYAGEFTDEDFVLDQEIEINFPNASERLNHCIVKFHNEANNFKEDSVSWPAKLDPDVETPSETYILGLNGEPQPIGSAAAGWDPVKPGALLLNNYAVWKGSNYTTTIDYIFIIPKGMAQIDVNFNLEYTADDQIDSISVNEWDTPANTLGALKWSATAPTSSWKDPKTQSLTLGNITGDRAYKISITATDRSGETSESEGSKVKGRGIAARLIQTSTESIVWSTREPAYKSTVTKDVSNIVYRTYFAEDNYVELEEEIFADGITDKYHAEAKAEELVRTSRGAFGMKIVQRIRDRILEPGDIIKLNISTLQLGTASDLYFRVEEINPDEEWGAELQLQRFDPSFLAWNIKDDDVGTLPPVYEDRIPASAYIHYVPPIGYYNVVGSYPDNHEDPGVKHPTITTATADGWSFVEGAVYLNTTDNIRYRLTASLVWVTFVEDSRFQSSGTLEWGAVGYNLLQSYILYAHVPDYGTDVNGFPVFQELGRTTETTFILPSIDSDYAVFGVRTLAVGGRTSAMTMTEVTWDAVNSEYIVSHIALSRPWLDSNGNLVFGPDGTITYIDNGAQTIAISDVVANSIIPAINYLGAFENYTAAEEYAIPLGLLKQNAVYLNTTDGNQYIYTGDPLAWEVYIPEGKIFYVNVEVTNGNDLILPYDTVGRVFKTGSDFSKRLSARLYKNGADVTDNAEVLPSWFDWTKWENGAEDSAWSAANQDTKEVIITQDDVSGTATFIVTVTTP